MNPCAYPFEFLFFLGGVQVVIHLGTNDLCCDSPVPHATFERAYVDFVRQVVTARRKSGTAPAAIFLGCGPMGNSEGNKPRPNNQCSTCD